MAEQKIEATIAGKPVVLWFDYEAFKKEQEWLDKKEKEVFAFHAEQNRKMKEALGMSDEEWYRR